MAAVDLTAGVSVGFERNDNAFDLSNREAAAAGAGTADLDDNAKRLGANVGASLGKSGPTELTLAAQYTKVDSQFESLDHSEYTFGGKLDWKPGQVFDFSLQGSQSRAPLSLADVAGNRSVQQTSSQADATLRVRPTPRWQIGVTPRWSETKTPLLDAPAFKLRENRGSASLDFLGAGRLVPGIIVSKAKGVNSGILNPTRYEEESAQGALNYRATGFSTFSLAIGRTKRTTKLDVSTSGPPGAANGRTESGFTGVVSYQRRISVKTDINLRAYRDFQQYDAGVNPAVNTGFTAAVNWAPTTKLSLALDAQHLWSNIKDPLLAGAFGERKELTRSYSLNVNYLVLRRISLNTYVTRRLRNSSGTYADQFNGNIAGVRLAASFD